MNLPPSTSDCSNMAWVMTTGFHDAYEGIRREILPVCTSVGQRLTRVQSGSLGSWEKHVRKISEFLRCVCYDNAISNCQPVGVILLRPLINFYEKNKVKKLEIYIHTLFFTFT